MPGVANLSLPPLPAHPQPMKCLCGAKSCRGIIGGTQEGAQPGREVVVPVGAEDEPEPIMVTGGGVGVGG